MCVSRREEKTGGTRRSGKKRERGGWIEEEKRGAANGEGRYPWQQPAAAQMDGVSFFLFSLISPPEEKKMK
jgi:hypothetical protein